MKNSDRFQPEAMSAAQSAPENAELLYGIFERLKTAPPEDRVLAMERAADYLASRGVDRSALAGLDLGDQALAIHQMSLEPLLGAAPEQQATPEPSGRDAAFKKGGRRVLYVSGPRRRPDGGFAPG